jgi:hypothetical protein
MTEEKPYRIKSHLSIPVEAVLEILPKEEISFLDTSEMKPSVIVIRNKKNPGEDQTYSYSISLISENFDIKYKLLVPTEEFDKILEKYDPF